MIYLQGLEKDIRQTAEILAKHGIAATIVEFTGEAMFGGNDADEFRKIQRAARAAKGTFALRNLPDPALKAIVKTGNAFPHWGVFETPERDEERIAYFETLLGCAGGSND